jgi:acyl-CoA hydrolase
LWRRFAAKWNDSQDLPPLKKAAILDLGSLGRREDSSMETNNQQVESKDLEYTTVSLKMVMHEDLNPAGRLFGGRLMEWVDENAALFCMKKMLTRRIVTKKISEVIFSQPADLGDILDIQCQVKSVGRTSLTAHCRVTTKTIEPRDTSKVIVECDIVFVALDEWGKPTPFRHAG